MSLSSVVILTFLALSSGSPSRCECVTFPTTEADRLATVRRELQESDTVFVGTMADVVDTGNSFCRLCQTTELCGKKGPQIATDKLPNTACSGQRLVKSLDAER